MTGEFLSETFHMTARGQHLLTELSWSANDPYAVRFLWKQAPDDEGRLWLFDRQVLRAAIKNGEPFTPEAGDFHIMHGRDETLEIKVTGRDEQGKPTITVSIYGNPGIIEDFVDKTFECVDEGEEQVFTDNDAADADRWNIDI